MYRGVKRALDFITALLALIVLSPLLAITATSPIASWLVVSLLMKSGTMVALDMKLKPSQKVAPSSRLTTKFQG